MGFSFFVRNSLTKACIDLRTNLEILDGVKLEPGGWWCSCTLLSLHSRQSVFNKVLAGSEVGTTRGHVIAAVSLRGAAPEPGGR